MKIEKMLDIFESQGRRVSDRMMYELILIYFGAILVNRYSYKKNVSGLSKDIKSFVLFFAASGIGKSWSIKLVEKTVCLEEYSSQMSKVFDIVNKDDELAHEYKSHLPTSPTTLISGSKEGLFSIARSINYSKFGSLNAENDEFVDAISQSNELLLALKQGYDGTVKAKVKQGSKGDRVDSDIDDIVFNLLGAGTLGAASKETMDLLHTLIISGIFRRSLVLDSKARPEKSTDEPLNMDELKRWFFNLNESKRDDFSRRVQAYSKNGTLNAEMDISIEAKMYIETIDEELLKRANDDQLSELKQFDTGSLDVIVNIAFIKCYIEGRTKVEVDDLKYGWSLFTRTRDTCEDTFKETQPHQEVFSLLSKRDNMTHSDLLSLDHSGSIPKAKNQWNDTILLVQELCYRQGKTLKRSKGIVERFTIEDLPKTNLNKLILSLSTDDKRQYAIAFEPAEMKWEDISRLAVSHFRTELDEDGEEVQLGVESFTLAHYEQTEKTDPYGHRRLDSFRQGQNVIAFDMDDGKTTIADVKDKFIGFKYLIYTTKSHNSIKGDYCDRFRVVIPCKTMYHVNPEEHKLMYRSIADFFDIYPDVKAYNVSRLLYTNKDAEVYENDVDELFDIQPFLPDTLKAEQLIEKMNNLKEVTVNDDDELQRRVNGYIKYASAALHVGNLNDTIHRTFMFVKDLSGDDTLACQAIETIQSITKFPMKFIDEYYTNHRIGR